MKFLIPWLHDYLPGEPPSTDTLRQRLTAVGFIVEGAEEAALGTVFDVEITANRPDGMNHRGLAREAAVALGRAFAEPPAATLVEGETPVEALAAVTIEEPALCSRFSARVIEGIRMEPASEKVRQRLEAIDLSPISAPVDATNHVLWDIGQPLHAYDLDKLAKGTDGRPVLVARRARPGETLRTLDGVLRTLTPEMLVIADAEKPVGLAGVMGGLDTAISGSTTRILLEAAHFSPQVVRKTARAVGLHTDASHRFERGADPATTREGLDRAARLIVADCGGTIARGTLHVVAREIPSRSITLRSKRRNDVLGMTLPDDRCATVLDALGFRPTPSSSAEGVDVTVPSWRIDVEAEIDLIEEVIRCIGYDHLPETLPGGGVPAASAPIVAFEDSVRDRCAGFGFVEACTYSFVATAENEPFASAAPGAPVVLENPLGEPFTTLRATPVVGLLKTAQHNVRRGLLDLALFEVGRSYGRTAEVVTERNRLALLLSGTSSAHWSANPRPVDFFDGSGAVASILASVGVSGASFEPAELPFLASGRSARVVHRGLTVGWVGVLDTALANSWDLTDPVVADLDLSALLGAVEETPSSVGIPSRFPGSDVDLTVQHPTSRPYRELVAAVSEGAPAELREIGARSRYQGPGVPEGFVKTTLNLRFGSAERSLSREEVNTWRDAAAKRLLGLPETRVDGIS